jgi:hypothetical protein
LNGRFCVPQRKTGSGDGGRFSCHCLELNPYRQGCSKTLQYVFGNQKCTNPAMSYFLSPHHLQLSRIRISGLIQVRINPQTENPLQTFDGVHFMGGCPLRASSCIARNKERTLTHPCNDRYCSQCTGLY